MQILTVIRKNGKTIIEMPKGANVEEILKENEIKTYLKIEIKDGKHI